MKKVVIIGAGPVGLTAAYTLLKNSEDFSFTIIEGSDKIGGISHTERYKRNHIDIGGHRFFSKNSEIMELWREILPLQGAPAKDDAMLGRERAYTGGADPEKEDNVFLTRTRVSRIYYRHKFFDYPISLKPRTLGIILFCLPIKLYLQAALLLSSGMLYTNSVISRVYCVIYLLLAMIALLYPCRKKHPVLFGLTVALLANTHICMCGMVGIIGIFMLVDFLGDIKSVSLKQNVFNVLGLAIAGVGVVMLVLPLLGSFDANCFTSSKQFTFKSVATSFFVSFQYITESGISPNISGILNIILSLIAQLVLITAIILLRKKRRTFIVLLFFMVFYMVLIGVIWYTLPSRGSLFLYTIVMIYVMGSAEETAGFSELKISSKALRSIVSVFKHLDDKADKSVFLIFTALMLLSVPSGIKYAVEDISGEFDPSKATAEFIRNNVSEKTLLVSRGDDYSALLTYLPERSIYSLTNERLYSYCSHETMPSGGDIGTFIKAAEDFDEVWLIGSIDENNPTIIYSNNNSMNFYKTGLNIGIYKFAKEEFIDLYKVYLMINQEMTYDSAILS